MHFLGTVKLKQKKYKVEQFVSDPETVHGLNLVISSVCLSEQGLLVASEEEQERLERSEKNNHRRTLKQENEEKTNVDMLYRKA